MASDQQVENYLERVWDNWKFGAGPCEECPNRDHTGCFSPYYGDGILDAEIAFVAETPGDDRDVQTGDQHNWKLPRSFREKRGTNSTPGWIKKGNRIPEEFFDAINGHFSKSKDGGRGIYFTNAKKCPDIDGKDMTWKNIKAKLHCREYLKPEMDAVNASVIVSFGEKPTDTLYELYNIEQYIESLSDEVLQAYGNEEPYIIPSYHWSNLNRNLRHLDGIDGRDEYWKSLASAINSVSTA